MHVVLTLPGRPLRAAERLPTGLRVERVNRGAAGLEAAQARSVQNVQDDALLAAACRQGEPGAVELLVARFQADVFGAALRLVHDRDAALELANSILFKVVQHLDAYDATRPLRPWVLRIATNESLNWLRARRREREHVLGGEASAVAFDALAGGPDPEAAALATERREAVRAALARLPDHYRLVLTLRFFHDLTYEEIAEQTGLDANTVGVQLLRARRRLREEIGPPAEAAARVGEADQSAARAEASAVAASEAAVRNANAVQGGTERASQARPLSRGRGT